MNRNLGALYAVPVSRTGDRRLGALYFRARRTARRDPDPGGISDARSDARRTQLADDPRQVGARAAAVPAGADAAGERQLRAGPGHPRPGPQDRPRAAHAAPGEPGLRRLPQDHRSDRAVDGELRRHRPFPHPRERRADRRQRQPSTARPITMPSTMQLAAARQSGMRRPAPCSGPTNTASAARPLRARASGCEYAAAGFAAGSAMPFPALMRRIAISKAFRTVSGQPVWQRNSAAGETTMARLDTPQHSAGHPPRLGRRRRRCRCSTCSSTATARRSPLGRADPDSLRHLVLGLRHQFGALDPGQVRAVTTISRPS